MRLILNHINRAITAFNKYHVMKGLYSSAVIKPQSEPIWAMHLKFRSPARLMTAHVHMRKGAVLPTPPISYQPVAAACIPGCTLAAS